MTVTTTEPVGTATVTPPREPLPTRLTWVIRGNEILSGCRLYQILAGGGAFIAFRYEGPKDPMPVEHSPRIEALDDAKAWCEGWNDKRLAGE